MPSTAKSHSAAKSRSQAAAQPMAMNALDLLHEDHERVNELFNEFEHSRGGAKKKKLAAEICEALTVHALLEEELFYPTVKSALKDKELVPEAAVEHASIKDLVAQIEGSPEEGEMFDARVKVLCEYVKHHVEEEEHEMFPKIRESKIDLEELGARMAQRMEALQAAKH